MDTGGDLCELMEELCVGRVHRSFKLVYIDRKVMLPAIAKSWYSWMWRSAFSALGSLHHPEMILLSMQILTELQRKLADKNHLRSGD